MGLSTLKKVGLVAAPVAMAANGLLGMGGKVPQAEIADYDQGTKDLLNKQIDRADETIEQIADRQTEGMDQKAQNFMDASRAQDTSQTAFGGANTITDDLGKALETRANRKYGDASALMKSQARKDAIETKISNTQRAMGAANAFTQQKSYAHATKLKNIAAKKQARAQTLGTVLGAGGAVAGFAFGGPMGGMAGAQIGQGVGQNVGGR